MDSEHGEQTNISHKTYEYICLICHDYLIQKRPKMPLQACANGLQLPPVPNVLQCINDIKWCVIGLCIPITILFSMHKYGSQYKIWGSCTNVPATLDQIISQNCYECLVKFSFIL